MHLGSFDSWILGCLDSWILRVLNSWHLKSTQSHAFKALTRPRLRALLREQQLASQVGTGPHKSVSTSHPPTTCDSLANPHNPHIGLLDV